MGWCGGTSLCCGQLLDIAQGNFQSLISLALAPPDYILPTKFYMYGFLGPRPFHIITSVPVLARHPKCNTLRCCTNRRAIVVVARGSHTCKKILQAVLMQVAMNKSNCPHQSKIKAFNNQWDKKSPDLTMQCAVKRPGCCGSGRARSRRDL